MPRFVILEHDHPTLHWDFMLEEGNHLATWRLPCPPGAAAINMEAERINNHRLHYLDYEGDVSGGRGTVKRWDGGEYAPLLGSETTRTVRLNGQRWRGKLDMEETTKRWFFRFEPDDSRESKDLVIRC